jgi:hypothetical protein
MLAHVCAVGVFDLLVRRQRKQAGHAADRLEKVLE